jgi:hypothetical protein
MDFKISNPAMDIFWRNLYAAMGIKYYLPGEDKNVIENRTHVLLLDGPLKK